MEIFYKYSICGSIKCCRSSAEHFISEVGATGKIVTRDLNSAMALNTIKRLEGRHFRWEIVLTTAQHQEIFVALQIF